MKTYGLKITQWGYGEGAGKTSFYLTSLPMAQLVKADYDRWTRKNREGYQRATKESRFRPKGKNSIVSYLLRESGLFPTSVMLNVRGKIDFKMNNKISDNIEAGEITFEDNEKLWIIDGQHRLDALKRAMHQESSLKDYSVPISLTNFTSKFDEMLNFFIVNSRQVKIPTDLVYRHLQTMQQESIIKEKKWLEIAILGEKETRAALATEIVDFLEDDDASPFKGRIQFTGEEREEYHLVSDYGLSAWISKILNETAFSQMDSMTLAELTADYWAVIKELNPRSFSDPKEHSLLKTTGLASYTYLFPSIFAMSASDGQVNKEQFKHYLSMLQENVKSNGQLTPDFEIPIDDNWWSRAHGPAVATSTGNKAFTDIMKSMSKKINIIKTNK